MIVTKNGSGTIVSIKPEMVEITGATVIKDGNGNKVNIFGVGDKVISVNGGVFSVDRDGKIISSAGDIGPFVISTKNLMSTTQKTIDSIVYNEILELSSNQIYFKSALSSIYQKSVYMGTAMSGMYGSYSLLSVEGGDIWHQGTVGEDGRRSCRFYSSDIHMRGIMKMYDGATITDYDGNVVIKNGLSGGKIKNLSIYGTSNTIASDYKFGTINLIASSGCNTTLSPGEFIGQTIYLINYTTSSCNLIRNDNGSKMAKLGGQKTAILYYNGTTWLPIAIINTYEF